MPKWQNSPKPTLIFRLQKGLNSVFQRSEVLSGDLAFPNNQHLPPKLPELAPNGNIAFLVCAQLRFPIAPMRFRHRSSATTTVPMPETAIDVDDFPQTAEYKIRRSWKAANVETISESERMSQSANEHLGRRVFRLDGRHDPGSLGSRDYIGHKTLLFWVQKAAVV